MPLCLVSAGKESIKYVYMSIFGTFISQSHHFLKTIRLIKYKTKFIDGITTSNTFC